MAFFGTTGVVQRKGQGKFYCPRCQAVTPYSQQCEQQTSYAFFIPVSSKELPDVVECRCCGAEYGEEILHSQAQFSKPATETEFQRTLKRVMVQMMIVDNDIAPAEVRSIQRLYSEAAGKELTESQVQDQVEIVRKDPANIVVRLRAWDPPLTEEEKKLVIRSAFTLAAADEVIRDEEQAFLHEIARALELPDERFREICDEFAESREAFEHAARRVMVYIMASDGAIDDAEIRVIQDAYHGMTGQRIADAHLRSEVRWLRESDLDIMESLSKMEPRLTSRRKRQLVRLAFDLAAADGLVKPVERDLIQQVSAAIRLADSDYGEIADEYLD